MSSGRIVEIIGAVIDVEFNREDVPKVYDALTVSQNGVTLEVQQQLGDGIVRTIAMGVSDGLSRGLEVTNTGAPISIPVGEETLGRIMDVLGNPIDEKRDKILLLDNRKKRDDESTAAAGAYVAFPKKGLHKWIGSMDLNSLYPSVIRALNLAPETIIGQIRPDISDARLQ